MSSYDHIDNEEELHKLMNATESFDERKKIRSRLRDIREKQRAEMEMRRLQREKETEDLVRRKFELAEEEKRRKMQAFSSQRPLHERAETDYQSASQRLIGDRQRVAEEEKQKRLEAYRHIAATQEQQQYQSQDGRTSTRVTTTTFRGPDGSSGMTKKTETKTLTTNVPQTQGFGGVQYGAPRQQAAAKPQGPRGAMAAFRQMDAANPAPKTNRPMARSPSAIKQVMLDWCKANVQEYENVEVTNFSSCWNNGMAFCALIHHFFPDAFDFKQLEPKNRRYNFNLAFDTAEKMADIMPLLDVEDMVRMKNPDWKCVFTYVQSIYRHLKDHERNAAKPVVQQQQQ